MTEKLLLLELIDRCERELLVVPAGTLSEWASDPDQHFVGTLLAILDFFLGCHHPHLSRVFTLQGETYKVCCDCGAKFAYSLETMSIVRRLPLTPASTRFRLA